MKNKIITGCFLVAASSSVFSNTFNGELQVLVFDNFKAHKSTTVYSLSDGNQTYTLDLPASIDKEKLVTGLSITVDGDIVHTIQGEEKIKVATLNIHPNLTTSAPNTQNRKIVTLLVNFSDKKTTNSVSVNDVNSILYTSSLSTKLNMERSSFNQVSFIPDSNQNGAPDIYQINLNYPITNTCDYRKWTTDARNAATSLGINLSTYQHHMIVLPEDIGCTWGGLGEVGCQTTGCLTWIRSEKKTTAYARGVYVHELGHNLGMQHAGTDTNNDGTTDNDYGDGSCFMGSNANSLKEANAAHRDHMKWFDAFPASIKTVSQNGSFSLSPLEAGASNNNLLALKIYKPDTSQYYYISYRTNLGPFGPDAPTYLNKVSIHKAGSNGFTYFIQTIDVNGTFVDTKNKLSFKFLSGAGNKANVQVTFGSETSPEKINTIRFFNNDNTGDVGYADWDFYHWKGNCPPYAEAVGLSTLIGNGRANAVACVIKDSTTSTAKGEFVRALGGVATDVRILARNGDWDYGYYKWECGLNEYVSSFSEHPLSNQLHKIRCAKGTFTNGGQNSCETRFVGNVKDDRGSVSGGDWDPNYYKGQCSNGKLIFGVSVDMKTFMPHKILCCNR